MTFGRTIKRTCAIAVATAATLALSGVTASADSGVPDHGHILLIGFNSEDFAYRKCVDLAGGRSVPLVAHHDQVHAPEIGQDGRGINVRGIRQAGHAVVPTAPITPFLGCP
jgi:hypothetical protein